MITKLIRRFIWGPKPHVLEVKWMFLREFGYLGESWEDVYDTFPNRAWSVRHIHQDVEVTCAYLGEWSDHNYYLDIMGYEPLVSEIAKWAIRLDIEIMLYRLPV